MFATIFGQVNTWRSIFLHTYSSLEVLGIFVKEKEWFLFFLSWRFLASLCGRSGFNCFCFCRYWFCFCFSFTFFRRKKVSKSGFYSCSLIFMDNMLFCSL